MKEPWKQKYEKLPEEKKQKCVECPATIKDGEEFARVQGGVVCSRDCFHQISKKRL